MNNIVITNKIEYDYVLIDTWWNVNLDAEYKIFIVDEVLIDTWWNVNILPDFVSSKVSVVLIDTWWNVNLSIVSSSSTTSLSF